MKYQTRIAAISLFILVAASGLLMAGPLNPPAGPVMSTYKTLTEVEPRIAINATNTPGDADSMFRITSPGSYYLTAQVSATPGKMGIEIAANGVTIDLNGYRVAGFPGSLDAIRSVGNLSDITVKNGSVGPISGVGIYLGAGDTARACRIENVNAADCGAGGISIDSDSLVSRCLVSECGGYGVFGGFNAHIADCNVLRCAIGIRVSQGSIVSRCTTNSNTTVGIEAINGCSVIDCTVANNTADGISCVSYCVIRGNNCASNGFDGAGSGIHAYGSRNQIEGNTCTGADRGIEVNLAGNIITKNTCSGNTINWTIVAGNAYGPIVATPAGAAVNGNTAAAALGSADPNANFTY